MSGHLGEVMKESAMTALSYLKANEQYLDISHDVFENYDLHIHVPSGAVPKDGPFGRHYAVYFPCLSL